ncbi:MAG: glycosyltransferase [Comamonadaceae bacterium]|nr:MAG: glycosyltransferase [Comamonadaceae bacterium]
MTRFAVIAPPFPSHTAAMSALASTLIDRGHEVWWMHQADVRQQLRDPRIHFIALGAASHPPGHLARVLARAAHPRSPWGLRRVIRDLSAHTQMLVREAAPALRAQGIEAILGDQMEGAAGLLAQAAALPWVSVACALPINREDGLPLPVMPWPLPANESERHRARVSARIYDWVMGSHAATLRAQSQQLGIAPCASLEACLSPRLQLSQTTAGFDFPRRCAPPHLHHVGPLRRMPVAVGAPQPARGENPVPTPGVPYVYASLGTLQGSRYGLFLRTAKACKALGAQLLVAHCGGLSARREQALRAAGARWVVHTADQVAVLARVDAMVTHAGLNTALECLAAGVPMLALPLAFDQPGVSARIVHAGAGLRLSPHRASVAALRDGLAQLLAEPAFRQNAQRLGREVRGSGGTAEAAQRIEDALRDQDASHAHPLRHMHKEAAHVAA